MTTIDSPESGCTGTRGFLPRVDRSASLPCDMITCMYALATNVPERRPAHLVYRPVTPARALVHLQKAKFGLPRRQGLKTSQESQMPLLYVGSSRPFLSFRAPCGSAMGVQNLTLRLTETIKRSRVSPKEPKRLKFYCTVLLYTVLYAANVILTFHLHGGCDVENSTV
jgi:hypothetical protein